MQHLEGHVHDPRHAACEVDFLGAEGFIPYSSDDEVSLKRSQRDGNCTRRPVGCGHDEELPSYRPRLLLTPHAALSSAG